MSRAKRYLCYANNMLCIGVRVPMRARRRHGKRRSRASHANATRSALGSLRLPIALAGTDRPVGILTFPVAAAAALHNSCAARPINSPPAGRVLHLFERLCAPRRQPSSRVQPSVQCMRTWTASKGARRVCPLGTATVNYSERAASLLSVCESTLGWGK